MKKNIFVALIMGFALNLVVVAWPSQVQAYEIKVVNGMSSNDGVAVLFRYKILQLVTKEKYYANHATEMEPGLSWSRKHTGLLSGCCFVEVAYRILRELPGCGGGNLKDKWVIKKGLWCRNVTFKIIRDGCSLKMNIK
jgi:hypothetical protein